MYVMRWAVSDLRERANRSTRLMKQYKEVTENQYEIIRQYRREPSLQHPIGQWLEAQAQAPDNCCLCEATEEGEYIGWVACPESCCERPDHSHQQGMGGIIMEVKL